MKSESTVARKSKTQPAQVAAPAVRTSESHVPIDERTGLPEPPLQSADVNCPRPIKQAEIIAYLDARSRFIIAKLDFERKRADLTLRVQIFARTEPGEYSAVLGNDDETVTILEHVHASGPVKKTERSL